MKRFDKILKIFLAIALVLTLGALMLACNRSADDNTAQNPQYHYINGKQATFLFELRNPSTDVSTDGDSRPHSAIDGELICSWQIPYYGNTVYESVLKFFEDREDNIDFRLSQYKYQMFHSCTLSDGTVYNLERAYVSADGKYSQCANYEMLLGEDNTLGTVDDLAVLVVVYDGWMNA